MIRLFDRHHVRIVRELDGMWDFTMKGFAGKYSLPVPGCWEQHPDFMSHRGKGAYEKKVYLASSGNVRLVFKGVSHTADIFWDGVKVAHHYNAYTPFDAVVQNVKAGWHVIRAEVDNTFGEHSALHVPNDYYTYGGITRPVVLEMVPDVYLEQVHFTPFKRGEKWCARIEVRLCGLTGEKTEAEVRMELAGHKESVPVQVQGDTDVVFEKEFDGVKPWSGEEPNLYLLNLALAVNGEVTDDLIERVGFRSVEAKDGRIFVNGSPVRLRGFNRHEDYPTDGCAVSLQHMVQDLDLMRDMNANAVRTCHYPNDERFLDLCDERGILVWEENHARGFGLERMHNPNFERQCEDCIREMIGNHYNHPSIIIWGILNECASETEEGRRMYRKQYEQIKSLDNTRPTTSATCRHFTDICLDLPDVVSVNLYSGWYEDCDISERNDRELEWIGRSGGGGKPVIVSEVGAGAVYGYRDRTYAKWSEERQAQIIRENLAVYLADERISGVFLWQFADCRVTEEEWFQKRPKSFNNKGVVDTYRRPKLAYDTVKEMFGAMAVDGQGF